MAAFRRAFLVFQNPPGWPQCPSKPHVWSRILPGSAVDCWPGTHLPQRVLRELRFATLLPACRGNVTQRSCSNKRFRRGQILINCIGSRRKLSILLLLLYSCNRELFSLSFIFKEFALRERICRSCFFISV